MQYPIVLALLWWQRLAVGLPGADRASVVDVPTTCRNPVSPFDYSAKARSEYELPLCRDEDDSHPVLGAIHVPSLLGGRATVDDYTCAPDRPCANSACCPKASLQCNYGEEACGTSGISPNDVCWSNCDAKSECGTNAKVSGQKCPLNVCCGKWGFCGMTEDYCDAEDHGATGGCQSNCNQPGPKNKAGSQNRVIGYYEAWRADSACQGMGLNDIPVSSLTHLYFSFASITPDTYSIAPMDGIPGSLFSEFTNLKKKNPALKTVIAIGGWTFNDPGPTQKVFSNMVSSARTRETFIDNLFSFLREYAFDGVDFDWEYPGADDRGGIDTDGANFVTFLKELNDANKKQPVKYVVSFTAPTSYWYLRHFDLKAVNYVDFVNVMSYDLHGVWDGKNPIGQHIYAHTNLTEMKQAFDLFWRNDVPANKLNMGLGFYGRAFQLQDPSCSKPGCGFKGGATKGGCSGESGILSYREIMAVIDSKKIKPVHDKTAGAKYFTWNSDQWVSYDDADTFSQKKDLAKDLGLGGFLIWAIDQDDEHLSALQAVINSRGLAKRAAVWGPVLSVPVGSYFCPPQSDDSAGPGTVCSKIGYAWDSDDGSEDAILKARALPLRNSLQKRAPKTTTICGKVISFPYPSDTEAKALGNPTYGFRTHDCSDYDFGTPLSTDTADSTYEAEHVLEFQLIKQFFDELNRNLGPFPNPDPSKATSLNFCQLVNLLWNIQPVVIPNLDTASGDGVALTPYNHVAGQFPTKTWHQGEYVRLDNTINSPPKASAWAGESSTYKQIQIVDFKKWIGGDPNDPTSPVNQDEPNYSGLITDIGGAEKIMKSMRAIVGSRLYQNNSLVISILQNQKSRVGEVLRRLDTEILPANPKQAGWQPWTPLGLKEQWDEFMKGKLALAMTKTNKVLNDILPRMQAQWANAAARDAAKADDKDETSVAEIKARKQRLIDSIDALANVLGTLEPWEWAF